MAQLDLLTRTRRANSANSALKCHDGLDIKNVLAELDDSQGNHKAPRSLDDWVNLGATGKRHKADPLLARMPATATTSTFLRSMSATGPLGAQPALSWDAPGESQLSHQSGHGKRPSGVVSSFAFEAQHWEAHIEYETAEEQFQAGSTKRRRLQIDASYESMLQPPSDSLRAVGTQEIEPTQELSPEPERHKQDLDAEAVKKWHSFSKDAADVVALARSHRSRCRSKFHICSFEQASLQSSLAKYEEQSRAAAICNKATPKGFEDEVLDKTATPTKANVLCDVKQTASPASISPGLQTPPKQDRVDSPTTESAKTHSPSTTTAAAASSETRQKDALMGIIEGFAMRGCQRVLAAQTLAHQLAERHAAESKVHQALKNCVSII